MYLYHSGHIYSREAIVTYLLQKTKQLKDQHAKEEAKRNAYFQKQQSAEEEKNLNKQQTFLKKDQGTVQLSVKDVHASTFKKGLKRHIDTETKEEKQKRLQTTSFWLAEYNPQHKEEIPSSVLTGENGMALTLGENVNHQFNNEESAHQPSGKTRPSSPMSGNPLRLKDLMPVHLKREHQDATSNDDVRFICSVSHQVITTQCVVAIKKTGVVMLTSVYDDLIKESKELQIKKDKRKDSKEDSVLTMMCPITGKKFKEKDVLHLQKAASGFAASGTVEAKKYVPTLT
jgi:nitric oxide synthase-interacting protein